MEEDSERNEIRDELSKMTFEELQNLKQKLGSKVYNEAMFGVKKTVPQDFKRKNKNRPREVSSKKVERHKVVAVVKKQVRDPRFDDLCGDFDETSFNKNYAFINKIRKREIKALRKELKQVENPEEKAKIKSVLQRLKNKEHESVKLSKKLDKKRQEREEKVKLLNEGKKPHFSSKLESKVADLVEQFTELKQSGKLQKHIEKRRKKFRQKERKSGVMDDTTRPWE